MSTWEGRWVCDLPLLPVSKHKVDFNRNTPTEAHKYVVISCFSVALSLMQGIVISLTLDGSAVKVVSI